MPDLTFPMPNITNILDLFQYSNTSSNGFFGLSILIVVFVVTFTALVNHGKKTAFASSSFITMVTSSLFMVVDLIDPLFVFTLIILTAASVILLYWQGGD